MGGIMQKIDFVTVTFREETDLLALQAKSFARFVKADLVNQIAVLINDSDDVKKHVIERIVPLYGHHRAAVIVKSIDELTSSAAAPYRSQQIAKLKFAKHCNSSFYVCLDSKNVFIKEATFDHFHSDRPLTTTQPLRGYIQEKSSNFYSDMFGLDRIKDPDRAFAIMTPFPIITNRALELMSYIETLSGLPFEDAFASHETVSEFMLYFSYLRKIGRVDDHAPGPYLSHTIWPKIDGYSAADIGIKLNKAEASALMIGLHRNTLKDLSSDAHAVLAQFLKKSGLS